jgi:3-deoxy-D-manno-octulosonic-acid transferase
MMTASKPMLKSVLNKRCKQGKEDPARIKERMGVPSAERPQDKKLYWFHAASVGEAQSCLIMIHRLLAELSDAQILITTGTVTSAALIQKRMPQEAIHQYYPLDHPHWVSSFLDHWKPDCVIWMESELWPVMLENIKMRNIPAALMNARLSEKSYKRWRLAGKQAGKLLSTFNMCITQTQADTDYFKALGAINVVTGDNIKYSADPLPYNEKELLSLQEQLKERVYWVFASTHDGEEDMACRVHQRLVEKVPNLLTIIVPRHPERREEIKSQVKSYNLNVKTRTNGGHIIEKEDQIYLADTIGELGLFYKLTDIACIGRSFSHDGGGGHNPIEAAQLDCAILHGPNVQNLQQIYNEFLDADASMMVKTEKHLYEKLLKLLTSEHDLDILQTQSKSFIKKKVGVIDSVFTHLLPILNADTPYDSSQNTKILVSGSK